MPKRVDQNAFDDFLNDVGDEALDQSANEVVTSVTARKQDNQILIVPIDQIDDYPNNPLKVKDDLNMQKLMASIAKRGINAESVVVRQKPNGRYELLAGHRRKFALLKLGIDKIRAEVRNVDDEEAEEIVLNSNMQHRDQWDPSEKIEQIYRLYVHRKKKAGRKKQGAGEEVGATEDILADEVKMSHSNLSIYIKLHDLSDVFKQALDTKDLNKNTAYQISFLDHDSQTLVLIAVKGDYSILSLDRAKEIRKAYELNKLDEEKLQKILGSEAKEKEEEKEAKIWKQIQKELPRKMSKPQAYSFLLDVLKKAKKEGLIQ